MTPGLTEPTLREATDGASLIAAGTHFPADQPEPGKPVIAPDAMVVLSEYDMSASFKSEFAVYVAKMWRPWAEEEKRRRRTIRFTLSSSRLSSSLKAHCRVASRTRLGRGRGHLEFRRHDVNYPLVGRLAEVSLNTVTAEIEIRPRDIDARIELDWYASVDNAGVAKWRKPPMNSSRWMPHFSPFDRGTFEPLLRTAATNLDVNGVYWPDEVPPEDRSFRRPMTR